MGIRKQILRNERSGAMKDIMGRCREIICGEGEEEKGEKMEDAGARMEDMESFDGDVWMA